MPVAGVQRPATVASDSVWMQAQSISPSAAVETEGRHTAGRASAAGNDLRLIQAVENGEKETVRDLLKGGVSANASQKDGATALAWAAYRDDLEIAELLLRAGAHANRANELGATPLSLACDNASAAMVEKLLKAGADPNAVLASGETALMTCTRRGNLAAVKSLLAHGADVNWKESRRGQTALMWAAAENHPEVARLLLEHGADVRSRTQRGFTPLLFAAQKGNLELAGRLLEAGANVNEAAADGKTPLLVASASGHEALSVFLLQKGANPNAADSNGLTALHYAVLQGLAILDGVKVAAVVSYMFRPNMLGLVKALLRHGENPNARIVKDPLLPTSDGPRIAVVGATPFLLAAATRDGDVMRALMAGGADPTIATQEHTTALMVAAGLGRSQDKTEAEEKNALEVVKLAVEAGSDINAANHSGWTALHAAAFKGADRIIEFLATQGAKMNVKDKFGQTPLSIAQGIVPEELTDNNLRAHGIHQATADLLRTLGAEAAPRNAPPASGLEVAP